MTLNPYVEQQAILAKSGTEMPQPVIEGMADGVPLTWSADNTRVNPYIAVSFGAPVAAGEGRSIAGEALQPTDLRVAFACVASDATVARQISGKLVAEMTGFIASDNCGPLQLIGGAQYTIRKDAKPTLYVSEVFYLWSSNQAA